MYATPQELAEAIGEEEARILTDRSGAGQRDDDVARRALEDAASLIDGYLTHRYSLPLHSVPRALRRIAIDLAVYNLAGSHATLTDDIKDRHKTALRLLDLMADGKIGLGLAEPADGKPSDADGSENVMFDAPAEMVMTRDRLRFM